MHVPCKAGQIALLVAQIGSLSLSVSQLREAQGRPAQAAAARRAAIQVADSADQWVTGVRGEVADQARRRGTASSATLPLTTPTRRPQGDDQGPSRRRR